MARYYVTHSCGHESEVHLLGKMKDRQWRLEQMALELCPECEKKAAEEWRARRSVKVAEWLGELDVTEQAALFGSEKQVAWAEDIRSRMLYNCLCLYDEPGAVKGAPSGYVKKKEMAVVLEYLAKKATATFWIDLRNLTTSQLLTRVREELSEKLAQLLEDVKQAQVSRASATEHRPAKEMEVSVVHVETQLPESTMSPTRAQSIWKRMAGKVQHKSTRYARAKSLVRPLTHCVDCGAAISAEKKYCRNCAVVRMSYILYVRACQKQKKAPSISFERWRRKSRNMKRAPS